MCAPYVLLYVSNISAISQKNNRNITTKTQKYLFTSCADNSRPYGYENSDLKNMYLSRQSLNSRLQSPILTQEQLLLARASKCSIGNANSAGPLKSCTSNKFSYFCYMNFI